MHIQEKLPGTVNLHLSGQQGLVRLQLINHQWGHPASLPAQYQRTRENC
jgi:hypothetical protein